MKLNTQYQQRTQVLILQHLTECQTCKAVILDDSIAKTEHDQWHKKNGA